MNKKFTYIYIYTKFPYILPKYNFDIHVAYSIILQDLYFLPSFENLI